MKWRAIVAGGLLCGVLDIGAAFVQFGMRGVKPVRVLQSIATGLLGRSAFAGGAATATLGLALHFLIAFTAAAVYYAASRQWPLLVRRPVLLGMLYGIAVYGATNFVVVPLSQLPRGPFDLPNMLAGTAIHMLFVGLPIALATRRYAPANYDKKGGRY